MVAPTDIPKDIPPIDLNEKPFDPKDFTGKGVEGGIATGVVGGVGPVTGEVFLEAQLDDPVQPSSGRVSTARRLSQRVGLPITTWASNL